MKNQKYVVTVDNFVGPLELLYDLVSRKQLDINQFSLAQIADDYLNALSRFALEVEDVGGFLEIASSLVLIKSLSILPELGEDLTSEEYQKMEDLEKRLSLYSFFKKYFQSIEERYLKSAYLSREWFEAEDKNYQKEQVSPVIDKKELLESMRSLIKKNTNLEILKREAINDRIKLGEKVRFLKAKLKQNGIISWRRDFAGETKPEKVLLFLAVLELLRNFEIEVSQKGFLTEIDLTPV
ncbi:MAG: hypothetical protein GF347_04650 [Candidatus Moranbacteria bacterium]|nr:hypothetical protein [Candidatus Moranbacteria bacterium]